jgi:hypothetical protein
MHPRRIQPAIDRMKLRLFQMDDGTELVDLPRAPLPDPETPAPVRFLPTWDAILIGHARRAGVMPEEHRSKIFNPSYPQSVPSFLVDGRVAGTWTFEKGKVKTKPFARLDAAAKRELANEGERLAELHA